MINEKLQFEILETDTVVSFTNRFKEFAAKLFFNLSPGMWQAELKKPQRTKAQNRALHLFCKQIAAELHGVGSTFRTISILHDTIVDADWNTELVKDYIWRPVQVAILKKKSTTMLKTNELDVVAKPIMNALTKKFGFGLLFPSQLSLQLEKDSNQITNGDN